MSDTIRGLADGLRALSGAGPLAAMCRSTMRRPLGAIPPTPMVGAIGVVDDVGRVPRGELSRGLTLVLLGSPSDFPCTSVFGRLMTGTIAGGGVSVDLASDQKLAHP